MTDLANDYEGRKRRFLEELTEQDLRLVSISGGSDGPWRYGPSTPDWVTDAQLRVLAHRHVTLKPTPNGDILARITDAGRAALQPTTQAPAQHLPRRGDAVERWLAYHMEKFPRMTAADLLTLYTLRADAGVALDADLEG